MNHLPIWIAAPLVAICMTAQAETVTLANGFACIPNEPTCLNVPSTPSHMVSIYAEYPDAVTHQGDITVILDDKAYAGTVGFASTTSILTIHPIGTLTAEDGSQITVDIVMQNRRTSIAGRARIVRDHWYLNSGTILQ